MHINTLLLLASFFVVATVIIVLYFWVCNNIDNFAISPIRGGGEYDPDIERLSGGMAGYSPSPYYRWSYSLYAPEEYYPYFGNPYSDYLPESIYSRTYYDRPYQESI
jgi:hypothetical protein